MHWQNTGRDIGTSASAILQVWLWGWTVFVWAYSVVSTLRFNFSSAPGGQAMNSRVLRQCRPLGRNSCGALKRPFGPAHIYFSFKSFGCDNSL